MPRKLKEMLSIILSLILLSTPSIALIDVDFDQSNGLELLKKYDIPFNELDYIVEEKLKLLRENYEQFKPSKMNFQAKPIIPKIIHIIWLGDNSLPQNFQYYIRTWRKFHPSWQMKIWKEEDLKKENFPNYDLYLLAESYAERADIMRYEILYRYGGVYIDADIECFTSFDELHHKYDFYINLEPPIINKGTIQVVNAMIGSIPHNPIFTRVLETIRKEWDNNTATFFNNFAAYPIKSSRTKHHLAVRRTMIPFSNVLFNDLYKKSLPALRAIILPIGYNMPFYPISDDFSSEAVIRPETLSIHHYKKNNSIIKDPGFSQSLFNFNVLLNDHVEVLRSQKYLFLNFQDLYNDHFPSKIEFKPTPQIPEIIYLYNTNNLDEKTLEDLKYNWQKINPFIQINLINNKELLGYIPQNLKINDQEASKLVARFYLLNQLGGVFVETNFAPANLQEFNYKYKFYSQLNTIINPDDFLAPATNFIASEKNHAIIEHVIKDIEEQIKKDRPLTIEKIKDIYLNNLYKYNLLNGKNILFTEAIFDQKRGINAH